MFEATLHELLCNSLGSVLNISREQLRISLWSGEPEGRLGSPTAAAAAAAAAATPDRLSASPLCSLAHGPDAGECGAAARCLRAPAASLHAAQRQHRPHSGAGTLLGCRELAGCLCLGMLCCAHVDRPVPWLRLLSVYPLSAQVPWRALRSPVVVELSDVHLRIALRRDEELSEGAAAERAWLTKQAELAAAELAALAAAQGGGGGSDAGGTRAGGVLWSFVQHVLSMLLNRLQLSVSKVHIEFEVGAGAGCQGAACIQG